MGADVNAATALLLRMSGDARVRRFIEARSVSRDLVSRFVAGESVSAALDVTAELLARGRSVSIRYLCSDPLDESSARERRKRIRKVLRRAGQAEFTDDNHVEVSVRPGALGARLPGIGGDVALDNLRVIAASAQDVGARVTVESEPELPFETTFALVEALHADYPEVGVDLWSVRRHTERDVQACIERGIRVRLSDGGPSARSEGADVFSPHESDLAYVRSLERLMRSELPFSVSARDRRVINISEALEARTGRPRCSFEYHLPMGVRPITEAMISDRGDRMRVHVPFGDEWYPYLTHRLAAQPGQLGSLFLPAGRR